MLINFIKMLLSLFVFVGVLAPVDSLFISSKAGAVIWSQI
jgi:hypothetical protein